MTVLRKPGKRKTKRCDRHNILMTTLNGFNYWCSLCEKHYYYKELDTLLSSYDNQETLDL